MPAQQAEDHHRSQVQTFADSSADMVCAITINYVVEAVGIVNAARRAAIPVAVSFTVETDGKLPTGMSLEAAIEQVDEATAGYAAYYMLNCAHPTHFEGVLTEGGSWLSRIQGLRANASRMTHSELNESPGSRRGQPRRTWNAVRRAQATTLPSQRDEWMLRNRPPSCGTDRSSVRPTFFRERPTGPKVLRLCAALFTVIM